MHWYLFSNSLKIRIDYTLFLVVQYFLFLKSKNAISCYHGLFTSFHATMDYSLLMLPLLAMLDDESHLEKSFRVHAFLPNFLYA